ncbi:DUF3916 domain-containing protein [Cupriavidus sp. IK-TO18]|uniref:DUF3916 domain-containing protein n=1 Tax=Cupriavidus sp. IK-TO18 TaxID=2782182 RepID=UPI0034CD5B38
MTSTAATTLLALKPASSSLARVTCAICLPDMFASEVCIHLDEDFFHAHVGESTSIFGERKSISFILRHLAIPPPFSRHNTE